MDIRNAAKAKPFISDHGETVRELLGDAAGGGAAHSLA
jgi:hypothetical protein